MAASTFPGRPTERRYPLSTGIRIGIGVATLAGGILGFLIINSVMRIACTNDAYVACAKKAGDAATQVCANAECTSAMPLVWGVVGAVAAVIGVGVVAVLVARSFGEWRMLQQRQHGTDTDTDTDA